MSPHPSVLHRIFLYFPMEQNKKYFPRFCKKRIHIGKLFLLYFCQYNTICIYRLLLPLPLWWNKQLLQAQYILHLWLQFSFSIYLLFMTWQLTMFNCRLFLALYYRRCWAHRWRPAIHQQSHPVRTHQQSHPVRTQYNIRYVPVCCKLVAYLVLYCTSVGFIFSDEKGAKLLDSYIATQITLLSSVSATIL